MRFWLSGPRILNGLVRPGISLGREDWQPHLPSWRRYELRKGLQAAAEARGEPMSREDCDYAIDRALATGGLDSAGNLAFHVKGTREEIVGQIMETAGAWGHPMTREQAEAKADAAIAAIGKREFDKVAGAIAILILIISMFAIVHSALYGSTRRSSPARVVHESVERGHNRSGVRIRRHRSLGRRTSG
jgi:hypothetical protein